MRMFFLFSASLSLFPFVKWAASLGCHRSKPYLDTGAAITGREIARCLFCVSVFTTTLGPECKHAHMHTHAHTSSQRCSLNHHTSLFKMDGWYLAFHYSHLCFSLSAVWRLISVSLFFVWYRAVPMHFYSLSYIAFFFIQSLFCICVCLSLCVYLCVDVYGKRVFVYVFRNFSVCLHVYMDLCVSMCRL